MKNKSIEIRFRSRIYLFYLCYLFACVHVALFTTQRLEHLIFFSFVYRLKHLTISHSFHVFTFDP